MGIQIRKQEPAYTLTKTKDWWIDFLVFLVEFNEQAPTEEIQKVVEFCIKKAREFVLSKDPAQEFALELHKDDALDLFIFLSDFKVQAKEKEMWDVVHNTCEDIKAFLTKRGEQDE